MQTNTRSRNSSRPAGEAPDAAADAAATGDLAALRAAVASAERQIAVAVALAGRVSASGAAEREHGLPLDLLLATDCALTGADRHTLITAGQVLDTMPALAGAHRDGRVSWGQVRHVVRLVKRRSLEDRAVIDARIGATLHAQAGVAGADPDAFTDAVDAAVDELVSRRAVEDRDERAEHLNRLWAQPGFDGRVTGGFDYDPVSAATLLNALAAAQGSPAADDPDRAPEIPTPQQRSAAAALVAICRDYLGGGGGRAARPAYVVQLAGSRLDASQPGRLRLRLRGPAPRVSARRVAADAAAGADVRVVLTDTHGSPQAVTGVARTDGAHLDHTAAAALAADLGIPRAQRAGMAALLAAVTHALGASSAVARALAGQRPLCDPDQRDAAAIPTATRSAVAARDQGCRFFGCSAPVDWCDVHHLVPLADGGDHHPDRLALICRPDHTLTHDQGWTLTLDPATGALTGRRGTCTWTTLPRNSPLAPAPPDPDPSPHTRAPPPDSDLPF